MKSHRLASLLVLVSMIVLSGQGCFGGSSAERAAQEKVTLVIWRVFDADTVYRPLMNDYRALHPNVSFVYRTLRIDEYKDELIRAFAEGKGPDIFAVHNTWMGEFESLMAPMPTAISIPFTEIQGTVKKQEVTVLRDIALPGIRQLERDYVDVVRSDVVRPYRATEKDDYVDRIFGLPLAVDTLALYYNRDLLNVAGVPVPPANWNDFNTAVEKLTTIGPNNLVVQSGAALGTARNVERASDILSILMMQNGTEMTDARGRATFGNTDRETRTIPGAEALRFYTDFASPQKAVYTWNASQPASFEAFVNGSAAMFFGYSYHLPLIQARSERLNFAVAPLPQIGGGRTVNFANYWVESVARSSKNQKWAWDFIRFASSPDEVTKYLDASGKPPALRSLINTYADRDNTAVFTSQLLTAQSWYHGRDAGVMEEAMLELIEAHLLGNFEDVAEILRTATNKVNQTL